ncbi:MAG TPA: WavE lipopolysaccharide synthesis family protein [Nitrospiraceae bacterium]
MAINESDITVVYQGPLLHGPEGTAEHIRRTQQVLPQACYILSTWDRSDCRGINVNKIVLSDDPGGLPGIKRRDGATEPNNINRQLRSTGQGLAEVDTPYAIKIRTDCSLEDAGLLREIDRFRIAQSAPRIVTSSLFTVDPSMFEQMPYHVSDWMQFGETSVLQTYWSAPFMDQQDATYYERHPYAHHSTFMDRRLRCRLAVEQYLASRYAQQLGYPVPRYHNDIRDEVLTGHRRFLGERMVILNPWDIGLRFPKYAWAYRSSFQQLNCLLFPDWYELYIEQGSAPIETGAPLGGYMARRKRKQVARAMSRLMDKAGPLLVRPSVKRVVNRLLAFL